MLRKVQTYLTLGAVSAFLFAMSAVNALAAADPTTGVDYNADLGTPILDAIKPVILAALGVFVLFAAINGGLKLFRKVTKTG